MIDIDTKLKKALTGAEEPSAELVRNVKNKLDEVKPAEGKHRLRRSLVLAAAVFSAVWLTATFAYGDNIAGIIQQFMFGKSSAKQVDTPAHQFEIVNWSGLTKKRGKAGQFATVEEARENTPFAIKIPSYLPRGEEPKFIHVSRFKQKDGKYAHVFRIVYGLEVSYGEIAAFHLFQYYIGPDAYINLKTSASIQKVMIGDIEATAVGGGGDYINIKTSETIQKVIISDIEVTADTVSAGGVTLYWMQDEILFEMYSDNYDLDTLIAIAETMQ